MIIPLAPIVNRINGGLILVQIPPDLLGIVSQALHAGQKDNEGSQIHHPVSWLTRLASEADVCRRVKSGENNKKLAKHASKLLKNKEMYQAL